MTQVNTKISNLKLPRELSQRCRDFVVANFDGLEASKEMTYFSKLLSPSLMHEVINFDFYHVIQAQECFAFDKNVLTMVLHNLKLVFEFPGSVLINQSEYNNKIFFVSNGIIDIYKSFNRFDISEKFFCEQYVDGKMFGEISATLNCRSDLSAICKNYCKIGILLSKDYDNIVFKYPYVRHTMWHRMKTENAITPIQSFFMMNYKNIAFLEGLNKNQVRTVSFYCVLQRFLEN